MAAGLRTQPHEPHQGLGVVWGVVGRVVEGVVELVVDLCYGWWQPRPHLRGGPEDGGQLPHLLPHVCNPSLLSWPGGQKGLARSDTLLWKSWQIFVTQLLGGTTCQI